jgi:alkylhydroperoxidase family enzyme
MARIAPLDLEQVPPASRDALERQLALHGRVTNMKRTLARSPVALRALMQWYDLHAEVLAFLGTRATTLVAHAVSTRADCLICSTFFRRWLIEAGENPDALLLDDRQQALVDYGRQIAQDANGVTDAQFAALRAFLSEAQVVTLTAFSGLMLATNVFNNALGVDLDDYLLPFRKGGSQ